MIFRLSLGLVSVRHVLANVLSLLALLLAAPSAEAASIEVKKVDAASSLVIIDGDLELADIDQFRNKVAPLSKATVAFKSDGGSLLAGIRIGMLIRVRNFITVVPDTAQCASACAVAWLGGARRYMGVGSKVGFHAAYVQKAGAATESGPGNAVLGAYLDQIGLPEEAIVYITQASPSSMKWMSFEEAEQHGIEVALLSPPEVASPPQPQESPAAAAAAPAAAQEPPQGTPAGRAMAFVTSLATLWSAQNSETLRGLDQLYGDKVFYHGKLLPRQVVLQDKHHFAELWPQRSYKIRPHSMTASCNTAANTCRVQGIMERELANAATDAKSEDVTAFDFGMSRSGAVLKIIAETSMVAKVPEPTESNPITSVQRTLERLLAQVTRIRPAASGTSGGSDGQVRPNAPVPPPH
jgi:hypothetical protein